MALPFKYNAQSLLDGSHDGTYAANKPAITIQVSADNDGGNYIMTIELGDFQSNSSWLRSGSHRWPVPVGEGAVDR